MEKNNRIKFFFKCYVPILGWMGLIFYFSSLRGEGIESNPDFWFYLQRKGAHVIEYFILTLLIARATLNKTKKKNFQKVFLAGAIALGYAFSDEIHQTFIFGREGKLLDIGIDSAGIILAMLAIIKKGYLKRYLLRYPKN